MEQIKISDSDTLMGQLNQNTETETPEIVFISPEFKLELRRRFDIFMAELVIKQEISVPEPEPEQLVLPLPSASKPRMKRLRLNEREILNSIPEDDFIDVKEHLEVTFTEGSLLLEDEVVRSMQLKNLSANYKRYYAYLNPSELLMKCTVRLPKLELNTPLTYNAIARCLDLLDNNGTSGCKFDFTGQGWEYQILAGPIFILIYTFAAIPVGFAADSYNRKCMTAHSVPTKKTNKKAEAEGSAESDSNNNLKGQGSAFRRILSNHWDYGVLLGLSLAFWSLCTFLSGFVQEYWQLALLRFGLGLGQSGCTPFATSLISDYFAENLRGSALGVYNWGIYTGYGLSYTLGNYITDANINGQGWRWTFFVAGLPGLFIGLLIIFTVREPKRTKAKNEVEIPKHEDSTCGRLSQVLTCFLRPSVLILCLGGAIRNAAGYVWAYNTQVYFEGLGETRAQIGFWQGWVPIVGGCIGVILGGFISDRIVKKSGPHGRIWVLIASQILAAPFAAGTLLLPTPWAYLSQIPTYIIGEMWVSVTLAVLVELIPSNVKTTGVAVYFFIISNIGGNMPLMVPVFKNLFDSYGIAKQESLRYTLLVLYPGEYVLGSLLFLLCIFVLKRDIAYIQSVGNGNSPRGSKSDIVTNMERADSFNREEQNQQTKM